MMWAESQRWHVSSNGSCSWWTLGLLRWHLYVSTWPSNLFQVEIKFLARSRGTEKEDSWEYSPFTFCLAFQFSCPSSSLCGTKTLRHTQGLRVVITEMVPQRSLLLGQAAPGPLPGVAAAVRVSPPKLAQTPPARSGRELGWTRTGIWML